MSAPEGTGGGGIGDKSSSASSSVGGGGGKPVSSGGGGVGGGTSVGGGQLSGTLAVAGGAGAAGVSGATATTTIPIDLASASKVLVRTDKTTMPTTTYRIGSAPGNQMRVVIPSSAAQQTYYRQPANIKQEPTTNRTQISALSAARTVVTQTGSLTVSRAQTTTPTTVSYHVSNRCVPATPIVTANLPPGAVRATTINGPIRISTPPIQVATNNTGGSGGNSGTGAGVVSTGGSTTYVRMPPNVLPARSNAQAAAAATTATIISQSNHNNSTTTTLVPNFQMSAQLIRATGAGTVAVTGGGAAGVGGGVPRARVVTQTTIPTNHHPVVVASGGTATPLAVVNSSTPTVVGGSQGAVVGGGPQTGGVAVSNTSPQAFVATLSTVLQAPRQVSTLVYTNNSATQQYTIGPNQQQQQHRLALATTTLSPQRPTTLGGGLSTPGTAGGIRPTIQRLPTAGIRVSNFRPPGLASTTVLTTIASGVPGVSGTVTNSSQSAGQQQQLQQQRTVATGTVVAPNISNAIPARIIQVQNPASGTAGTAQIVNGRIQTNLLNIQPLIVSSQNRLAGTGPAGTAGGLQPAAGLTIAQVGKLTQVATGGGNEPITTSAGTATLQTASGQQIVVSTTGPGGGASPAATLIAGNLIATGAGGATHHGGQITHQIVGMNAPTVVSVATGAAGAAGVVGSAGAGTATTVIPIPLALTGARQATVGATSGHSPLSIVTGPTGGIVRTGGTSGVVGTGTATSIASVLPIAKVTPQQQQPLVTSLVETNAPNTALHYSVASGVVGAGPSLYIQTRPGVASGGAVAVATSGSVGVPKGATGATLSVVSSTGTGVGSGAGGGTSGAGASATTFLPTSTFYYERLTSSPAAGPVSIAAATSGVGSGTTGSAVTLSSSTAITTTSAISGPVFSISSSSSVISSSASNSSTSSAAIQSQSGGPHHSVVSSLTSYGASGSFAIVQAAAGGGQGGRATLTSGPIHGLVPASLASGGGAGGNVVSTTVAGSIVSVSRDPSAAVVVGGSGGAGGGSGGTTGGTTTTTQIVPIRFHPQLLVDASGHHQAQQIIVSSSAGGGPGGAGTATNIVPLIPVNATSINVTSTSTTGAGSKQQHQVESPQSSILRKRALEGTLKTLATPAAGRDLTQALMAVEKQQQQQELTLQLLQQHSALQHQPMELRGELIGSPMSPSRPPSSDGSTTVSATSTPGLDDQEDTEMRPIPYRNSHGGTSTALVLDGGHFKPVQEELQHFAQQQHHLPREQVAHHHHHHHGEGFVMAQSAASSTEQTLTQIVNRNMAAIVGSISSSAAGNGSSYEQSSARKKARKQLLQPMADSGTVGTAGGSLMKSSSSSSSSSSSAAAATTTATGQTSSQQQQVFMAQDHVDGSGGGVTIGADGSSYAMSTAAGPGIVILTTGGAQHHLASGGSHKHNSVSGAVPKPIAGSSTNSSLHNNVKLEPPTVASGQQQQQQDAGAAPAPQPGSVVPSTKPIVSSSRKTNNVSLLQSYKQTWKAANNHFQRYTDVKQREERRPTVMDIANQSHILQKVNGWKIYHLSAQIEELCDLESQAYGKLAQMLRSMEASGSGSSSSSSSASGGSVSSIKSSSTDIERINDLLKGNMQRSKIVMDGINEARTQIMKIFDHKPRVSDIILRCASKRNFKKREKT